MAFYALFEIAAFAVTIPFLWYFLARTKIGKPLAASMLVTAVFEILNETVFAGVGTVYPDVLVPFPFFSFPLVIIPLGGFYSGIINFTALKAAGFFKGRFARAVSFLITAALLNLLSIVIESFGIYSGLWRHSHPTGISTIYFAVYVYYLIIVFSASVFTAAGILNRKASRSSQA